MKQTHDREAAPDEAEHLRCEECQMPLWKAGEVVQIVGVLLPEMAE